MPLARFLHIFRLGLRNTLLHRLRSFLTLLGIVLGVGSVVIMLAVGEALKYEVIQQLKDLGATNIIVRSVKPREEDRNTNQRRFMLAYGLTFADLERIRTTIPTITSATPLREFRKDIRYLDRKLDGRVVGVMPEFLHMNGLKLAAGRFIDDLDNARFSNVCVIGAELAETLFPFSEPLGKALHVSEGHHYVVVGVTEHRSPSAGVGSSLAAQDYNRDVYVPFATDKARFGKILMRRTAGAFEAEKIEISQITVGVDRLENVKETAAILQSMLDQYHPQQDVALTVPLDLLEQHEKTQWLFTLVLAAIASISLLVGGIGIMNIMLATVTERTREIGVRRALGAKRRDIAWQFLVETLALSNTGGMLGVVFGIGLAWLITYFFDFRLIIQPWSPVLAFSVSVGVGLLSGIYPARRAAAMDPIEALRHE
jgi:putative ABC transport system permease protein